MRPSRPVFVGRHEERRVIEHAFDDAREGRGVALLIDGLAGTGKSRLVDHAVGAAREHGFLPLLGIAADGEDGTPYGLWLDAFRRQLRAQPAGLPWLDPNSAWTRLVTFGSAAVLQGPQHAFHEISQALQRQGGRVLLALENLHWADRASLEIIETLIREIDRWPLVLVTTCRSDSMTAPARSELIQQFRRHPRVRTHTLSGFSLAETREFVDAMLPTLPDRGFLVRQLHRRTEGHPLFLEELVRVVCDEGRGADAALPISFRESVRCRLTGLTRDDMRLLQLASVIGEWFDLATLAYLARRSEGSVREALVRLRAQPLIRDTQDGSGFKFWHALTRDALYEQLLLPDRKALHRRVAQRWMSLVVDGDAARACAVAYHLEKAGEELEAAKYYAIAAERAAALFAFDEAFAHAERALAFGSEDRGAKALQVSRYARLAGQVDTALEYCRQAQQILAPTADVRRRVELLLHESDLHWLRGDGTRAAKLLQAAAKLRPANTDMDDAPEWAWLLARQAHRAGMESRWSDVPAHAEAAIAMSGRLNLPAVEAHTLVSLALAQAQLQGTAVALETLQTGRALAQQHDLVEDICRSYVVEIDLWTGEGEFGRACTVAVEAADRARRIGAPVVLYPTLAISAVELLWKTGRWREALDRLPETERRVNDQPSDLVRTNFLCVCASIAIDRRRLAEAEACLARATALAKAFPEPQWALPVELVAVELALVRGDPTEAIRRATRALERFPRADESQRNELHARILEAQCLARSNDATAISTRKGASSAPGASRLGHFHARLAAGYAALLADKPARAGGEFAAAAELAIALGLPLAEARAREWLATARQREGTPDSRHDAVRQRARARAILEAIPGRPSDGASPLAALSEREQEVARLVARGLANKEVGAQLSISERTVAVHVSRIFEKVGVESRHRLAALMTEIDCA